MDDTPASASGRDGAVLSAVLQDFSRRAGLSTASNVDKKRLVLLHERSLGTGDIRLSDSQIESDLEDSGWAVPQPMRENLRARNSKAVPLRGLQLGKNILVLNLADERGFVDYEVVRRYPERKAYVRTWLPGFSADVSRAVVRFDFGDSPHGATATYLLQKQRGQWKVQRREFTYYI